MEPEVLLPMPLFEGELLLRPGMFVDKAYYLKKGLVKMYYYNEEGQVVLIHIWDAGSIVVLFRKFKINARNHKYYMEAIEDSELVAISSVTMGMIYQKHSYAQELTDQILGIKRMRMEQQTEILQMTDKKRRYVRLKQLFPEFLLEGEWRLSNEEICAFINVSESTLADAKLAYP